MPEYQKTIGWFAKVYTFKAEKTKKQFARSFLLKMNAEIHVYVVQGLECGHVLGAPSKPTGQTKAVCCHCENPGRAGPDDYWRNLTPVRDGKDPCIPHLAQKAMTAEAARKQ